MQITLSFDNFTELPYTSGTIQNISSQATVEICQDDTVNTGLILGPGEWFSWSNSTIYARSAWDYEPTAVCAVVPFKKAAEGGGGSEYVLPVATASRLGGVKSSSDAGKVTVLSDGTMQINGGTGGGIAEYTTGTSYSAGDVVIKDQALYQANTNTSTTWVDSEWDVIGTTFNTTSVYAQKIVTNVVAPYEMLLQVGDSNYCKPPIDVLKKTGGSDNVTLTLENYNNASAYTGTSDFLKIENSKAKLYNYKEYPITTQTLSTIDIGVSDEIDFSEFYADYSGSILSKYLIAIRATSDGIVDLAGNTWTNNNVTNTGNGRFGGKALTFNGIDSILTNNSSIGYVDKNEDFTICCWVKHIPNSKYEYSIIMNIDVGESWAEGNFNAFCVYDGIQSTYGFTYRGNSALLELYNYTSNNIFDNNWHYYTLTRKQNVIKFFLDGQVIQTVTYSDYDGVGNLFGKVSQTLYVGKNNRGGDNKYFNGYLDDLCIIKGEALWSENFTPPTDYLINIYYNISSLEVN